MSGDRAFSVSLSFMLFYVGVLVGKTDTRIVARGIIAGSIPAFPFAAFAGGVFDKSKLSLSWRSVVSSELLCSNARYKRTWRVVSHRLKHSVFLAFSQNLTLIAFISTHSYR